jgi:hypothetical protein
MRKIFRHKTPILLKALLTRMLTYSRNAEIPAICGYTDVSRKATSRVPH